MENTKPACSAVQSRVVCLFTNDTTGCRNSHVITHGCVLCTVFSVHTAQHSKHLDGASPTSITIASITITITITITRTPSPILIHNPHTNHKITLTRPFNPNPHNPYPLTLYPPPITPSLPPASPLP